jgi:hypothetical protein
MIAGGLTGLFQAFGPPPLGRDLEVSTLVLDRMASCSAPI